VGRTGCDLSGTEDRASFVTKLGTAVVVAGGSSLICSMFELFGLRAPGQRNAEMRELTHRASVKVKVTRSAALSQAEVLVYIDGAVVGNIKAGSDLSHSGRMSRGFLVEPGLRTVKLAAVKPPDAAGGAPEVVEVERPFTFAPRARATVELAFS